MKLNNKTFNGDCLEVMKTFPDGCIDTIITDPPYGLELPFSRFTKQKKWVYKIPTIEVFEEMLRVAKPGTVLMCFGATRVFHRLMVNIEDAGWWLDDTMMWLYGQGFPKSVDISYMMDKNYFGKLGGIYEKRVVSGELVGDTSERKILNISAPANEMSKKWNGWGTGLKPAWEPIVIAHKPIEGNWEDNAIKYGVAGLWIDGGKFGKETFGIRRTVDGRWPTNVVLDEEALSRLDDQNHRQKGQEVSRFFYCAKTVHGRKGDKNKHPSPKPIRLMEYLCKLSKTPDGGLVLDPYGGSGSTAIACVNTGRDYILIELDEDYYNQSEVLIKEAKIAREGSFGF